MFLVLMIFSFLTNKTILCSDVSVDKAVTTRSNRFLGLQSQQPVDYIIVKLVENEQQQNNALAPSILQVSDEKQLRKFDEKSFFTQSVLMFLLSQLPLLSTSMITTYSSSEVDRRTMNSKKRSKESAKYSMYKRRAPLYGGKDIKNWKKTRRQK